MISIFEDDGNDCLSKLFRESYSEEVSKEFVYLKGIGHVINTISNLLLVSTDTIVIFMDIVPDNRSIRKVYTELRLLSIRNNYRIIVIPIVCSEYMFLKSIRDFGLVTNTEVMKCCMNKKPYYHLLDLFEDGRKIRTFEKFCKAILTEYVPDCIFRNSKDNKEYNYYFANGCSCSECLYSHSSLSVIDKSLRFISKFPCVPAGSVLKDPVNFYIEDIWTIHRKCIAELNIMIQDFISYDYNIENLCKEFVPIK